MDHFYHALGVFKPEFRDICKPQSLGSHGQHWIPIPVTGISFAFRSVYLRPIYISSLLGLSSTFFSLPLCHRFFFLYVFRVSFSLFFSLCLFLMLLHSFLVFEIRILLPRLAYATTSHINSYGCISPITYSTKIQNLKWVGEIF